MELLRLLQIDSSLIGSEARESLLVAERVWHEEGCPREGWALAAALEKILRRCAASGIWYAPVLLQRKKALERGTWRAAAQPSARALQREIAGPARAASPGAVDSAGPPCERCGGSGVVNAPAGTSGTLCECGAYLRRFVKNA
jgi:hypothetical protein